LTLLLPPIGDTGSDRALARVAEIMDQYNSVHACREKSRVEYVSEELLARFDQSKLAAVVRQPGRSTAGNQAVVLGKFLSIRAPSPQPPDHRRSAVPTDEPRILSRAR